MEKENDKHAYLIMAHKDDYTFRTLIKMLDYEKNDIFIHMDIKNKLYNAKEIENICQKSNVYHTKRSNVMWGGYSQINAEMLLLSLAIQKGKYRYYHLLSGEDLPIKSQYDIHKFFDLNRGKEFIRFEFEKFMYEERVAYLYPLQDKIGRNKNIILKFFSILFLKIQKIFKIKRKNTKNIKFQKGTNWFSITDELANYIVSQSKWIEDVFNNSFCCDEVFLQTIVANSKFKEKLYHQKFDNDNHAIMRLIDWTRGRPYIFRLDDLEEIKKSDMLFARKFNSKVDSEIIKAISNKDF